MSTIYLYIPLTILLYYNLQYIFCENYTTEITKNLTVNNTKLIINDIEDPVLERNFLCVSQNSETGICKNYRVCINQGGQPSGYCRRNGPRVCCVFNSQSGTENNNPFYFQNPGYPNSYTNYGSDFTYTVYRIKPRYTEIRLDFVQLNIQTDVTATGTCNLDAFSVYNGYYRTPNICGTISGTSLYVRFEGNSPIQLLMHLDPNVYAERIWSIRITQIAS